MFERRDLLLNEKQIENINKARIALFGLGGVGGYILEALVRMGITDFFLCDGDTFSESNLNRQILSVTNNIGFLKVEEAKKRVLSINPNAKVEIFDKYIDENTIKELSFDYTYIIDAIDDVKAKVLLIKEAKKRNIKIISSMGAGNRLNASFIVSDIYKTEYDPLSKKMRTILRREGIDSLKVVYTKDLPLKTNSTTIGSISYVVGMMGIKIVEEVILDIINGEE